MNSQQCWKAKFESALFSRVQFDEITVWLVLIYGKFIYFISIFQEYETSRREAQRYTWEQWKDFKAMMQKYNLANSSGVELIRDEFFEGQCRKIFSKRGNRILRYGCWTLDTSWVPDDIERYNFQNLLVFGFPEIYQNLMAFRKLLFSLFPKGKT